MNIWKQYTALVVDFHHVSVKSYWEKLELVSLIEQQTAIYLSTKIYRKIENSSIRKRRIHTLKNHFFSISFWWQWNIAQVHAYWRILRESDQIIAFVKIRFTLIK